VLLTNQDFLDACGRGTAGAERVRRRLDLATVAFASIPRVDSKSLGSASVWMICFKKQGT
jgi:hypothetical protein